MKWTTSALAAVAAIMVAVAALGAQPLINTHPTAVISVPQKDGVNGGGFAINLPANLTSRQATILSEAYAIAKADGLKPELLQGIVLQETNAGEHQKYKVAGQEYGLKSNDRYYGVTQIKLTAARDVLNSFPSLKAKFGFQTNTDEEVIAKLIENDQFNLSVASKYLVILQRAGFSTIKQLALAYNQGPGGAQGKDPETFAYANGVMKYIQSLQPKNHKT